MPRGHERLTSAAAAAAAADHASVASAVSKLTEMGFSRRRALKAVMSTGYFHERDVDHCVSWLISHTSDPLLDVPQPREYIMYLCPDDGPLKNELDQFWKQSQELCGTNGVHDSFPHIRLCTFFPLQDDVVFQLLDVIESVCRELRQLDFSAFVPAAHADGHASSGAVLTPLEDGLEFEYRRVDEPQFLGLFLSDRHDAALHAVVQQLAAALAARDIMIEPYGRKLHVTLAYRFGRQNISVLDTLAQRLDLKAPCSWSLRVYSRDKRVASSELRRVIHPYEPRAGDELKLDVGDIILTESDSIVNSVDNWYRGTSHSTGGTGMYPANHTEKTMQEHSTWTLLRKFFFVATRTHAMHASLPTTYTIPPRDTKEKHSRSGGAASPAVDAELLSATDDAPESVVDADSASPLLEPEYKLEANAYPLLLFVRHGERVDAVMGKDWVKSCFERSGSGHVMRRRNLNMPDRLPRRKQISHYELDCPLTEIGKLQAALTGKGIARSPQMQLVAVYSSPSLRCIETAEELVKALPEPLSVRVETGLFEWMGWYRSKGEPVFMKPTELKEQGFHVDVAYRSHQNSLDAAESLEDYYDRSHLLVEHILRSNADSAAGDLRSEYHHLNGGSGSGTSGGSRCVVLVAHAATPEVCTRKLLGGRPRGQPSFLDVITRVPFCGSFLFGIDEQERSVVNSDRIDNGDDDDDYAVPLTQSERRGAAVARQPRWKFYDLPFPPLLHRENKPADATIFASI